MERRTSSRSRPPSRRPRTSTRSGPTSSRLRSRSRRRRADWTFLRLEPSQVLLHHPAVEAWAVDREPRLMSVEDGVLNADQIAFGYPGSLVLVAADGRVFTFPSSRGLPA